VIDWRFWKHRKYQLDKMSLGDLVVAYFLYPAILAYLGLAAVSAWTAVAWGVSLAEAALAVVAVVILYPLVWYGLHRFVLHGHWLYRSPWTASVWKRIHFDHHRDPHDLTVLFGALYTTLPTVFIAVAPAGWLIGGAGGAAAAFAAGCLVTCFYEFCHCVQHLAYTPKSRLLRRIKKLHLAHHFHDETGNFGITNFLPDRLFGTFYPEPRSRPASPTVFNLGYSGPEVRAYPWVARLTDDLDEVDAADHGIGRRRPPVAERKRAA